MRLSPLFIRAYSPPIAALSSTNALHTATSPRRPRRPFVYACTSIGLGNSAASRDAAKPPKREISTSTSKNLPEIVEDDLEEQFVRGSGPGGQKINKTACCVVLKHKPSGIIVRCQETRSQVKNREVARKILQRKLDEIEKGEESLAAKELFKARARKARRRRKSVKKHYKSRMDKAMMSDWS
ncbi:Probable peptide chain release factor C12orf65, mitochondrial [Chondrus crispus]|uniref:Probable peptide chain release factor C12orf65, mitochondrial n=1 Tax=Chondrus crispus TaxID=2769 RepID=R7Q7E7_CHOCR|nr:Probable peptide chain release factor C12orf65, mitochondrial [Chondrus crispus]CDF34447.1 Probable peptide chain release factor C12orf65, mitochondrial [Chondrus crispus]|eukprot:XP_005714266.1 Probable peptide chain release factor C12orf65, mitochondrial [Chondrus crispus]